MYSDIDLDAMLKKPWTSDGKTFTDRCWEGKANLIDGIQKELTQSLLRGDSLAKTRDRIAQRFEVSKYKAGRLAHTEATYFNAVSSNECYKDLGVDQIEILETLDKHTCEICAAMDGKVIAQKDYQPGVTVPPFHPNCRGTTMPYFDDMDDVGQRIARDQDGEVYYVPPDMTYRKWEKTFQEGGSKTGLTTEFSSSILPDMKEQNVTNEYLKSATPGKGDVTYDDGYKIGKHREEIAVAEWLHNTFGGDIHVFNERGYTSVSPNYQWRGKLWELKNPSTTTSTDNAVKKALKQIKDNPGGIILDYGEHSITDEIKDVVRRRIERNNLPCVDVIYLQNGKLIMVLRYKK